MAELPDNYMSPSTGHAQSSMLQADIEPPFAWDYNSHNDSFKQPNTWPALPSTQSSFNEPLPEPVPGLFKRTDTNSTQETMESSISTMSASTGSPAGFWDAPRFGSMADLSPVSQMNVELNEAFLSNSLPIEYWNSDMNVIMDPMMLGKLDSDGSKVTYWPKGHSYELDLQSYPLQPAYPQQTGQWTAGVDARYTPSEVPQDQQPLHAAVELPDTSQASPAASNDVIEASPRNDSPTQHTVSKRALKTPAGVRKRQRYAES